MQNLYHPLHLQKPLLSSPTTNQFQNIKYFCKTPHFRVSCSSSSSSSSTSQVKDGELVARSQYKPTWLDDFFLNSFRKKLVEEVGWESKKEGYDGMMELVNGLMIGRTTRQTNQAAVRILRSLFPPFLLELYRMLITPIGGGRVAAMMVARVTVFTCQWLMGSCSINSIDLPDGSSCQSGVLVERCKYLEESKCVGICVNTCKIPTQTFFKNHMGIPLLMEPNFTDYSCQFKFGIAPPLPENDSALKEPCLDCCPYASRGRSESLTRMLNAKQCPRS
ncbi:beta-carotene isomerase D27, chloroplastic isoform X1 [Amaranthus tricolor]|uniref:beta-carotene isomerase D27, chloroplastic isoform X1 n=1 Tax=Amaranthus tricolor TaxID=29722 RepID=UPI002590FDD0|nr:beta-carotene isomerase D27, chloroplastic isoform X1 [Amaranthus tricolor]